MPTPQESLGVSPSGVCGVQDCGPLTALHLREGDRQDGDWSHCTALPLDETN
ncbi:hypothetical protein [Nostoc sp. CCY 9925]|uniref:hypothetical protein n=1 Tax=Nostoc sp. CCY 9925 TaxID=3103865 RepID=UPI0039C72C35